MQSVFFSLCRLVVEATADVNEGRLVVRHDHRDPKLMLPSRLRRRVSSGGVYRADIKLSDAPLSASEADAVVTAAAKKPLAAVVAALSNVQSPSTKHVTKARPASAHVSRITGPIGLREVAVDDRLMRSQTQRSAQ